jgi:flavin prenyltransferase
MTTLRATITNHPIVLGICGASGQLYARWVLKVLTANFVGPVHVIVSAAARSIIPAELGLPEMWSGLPMDRIVVEAEDNVASGLASGSVPTAGMIVCPCSLNTLAAVAGGISDNLIKRAAQVHLKQRRRLVLAVREMPVGLIDLENMVRVTRAGGMVTPISPAFYHQPKTMDDLAEFAAQKLVQLLMDWEGGYRYQPPIAGT